VPTVFPGNVDSFVEPSAPETTPLSGAGTGNRNHYESHRDMGDAIEALEANVAVKSHDHSGTGFNAAPKLLQANTHQSPDTDTAPTALHHTLGAGANQAAPGNHHHVAADITGLAQFVCTSTTRPATPVPGAMIYETDTNRIRVWTTWAGESSPRWVLLPAASKPVVRLLQGTRQQIVNSGSIVEWRTELEDTFGMFDSTSSLTEVVIREPGLYVIDCSIAWDPDQIWGDRAQVRLMKNGVPTPKQHFEFVRGNLFTPGFSQAVDLSCQDRFAVNDRLTIQASHNGFFMQWLFSSPSQAIDSRLDISYMSP